MNTQRKNNGCYINNLFGFNFYVRFKDGLITTPVECTHGIAWISINEWFSETEVRGIVESICWLAANNWEV